MLHREEPKPDTVKVYLRNNKKYAKKMLLPIKTLSQELYRLAAQNYQLSSEAIHLYYAGNLIERESETLL